jgi:two-component sensor histidine kinase
MAMGAKPSPQTLASQFREVEELPGELAGEADHRVANSLQMLAGIIQLQEREVESEEGRAALADVRRRVMCIARLHRTLCANEQTHVAFDILLNQIATDLSESFIAEDRIEVLVNADPIIVTQSMAQSLGLIACELLTDAIKHGSDQHGVIEIICGPHVAGPLELQVINDLPTANTPKRLHAARDSSGIGHRMIKSLLERYGGELQVHYDNGRIIHKVVLPMDDSVIAG